MTEYDPNPNGRFHKFIARGFATIITSPSVWLIVITAFAVHFLLSNAIRARDAMQAEQQRVPVHCHSEEPE